MSDNLIAKLAKASTAVGALRPDKTNTDQNYSYISADKILQRAGDALAEVGVVILPAIISEETTVSEYTNNYNKTTRRFDAIVHFMMLVTDGDKELERPWVGRGSDYATPDKALYKAITSGHKYFLAKLLNVGIGNEDGEHESIPQMEAETASQPKDSKAQSSQNGQSATTPQHRNVNASTGEIEASGDAPTDEELEIINQWRGPMDAQMWAVKEKYCSHDEHARKSWMNSVRECKGYTDSQKATVFLHFLRHQLTKEPS